jgi:hypothetical protein
LRGNAWRRAATLALTLRPIVGRSRFQESVMDTYESLERAFDLRGTPADTRRVYTGAIARFEEFFDDRPAWELGRAQIEQFVLHLVIDRGLSPSTNCRLRFPWVPKSPKSPGTMEPPQMFRMAGYPELRARRRHPSAHRRNRLGVQSAARVQGGEAGERSERTLDAREH